MQAEELERFEEAERIEEEKETGRLEAFCDAVFAIAMTLLILELKAPLPADLHGSSLLAALHHEWPAFLAFVTSFASILIMWVNHHNLMMQVKRVDHAFLLLNGLLLFGVTIIPFTTDLIAEYLEEPGARVAAVIYSGAYMLIAISYNVLWRYASYRGRLLARDADLTFIRHINAQYLVGPVLYLVAFLLAFFSAVVSFAFIGLLAIFFAFPVSLTSRLTAFTRTSE
jgi:uncharacterized membrane protein